MGDPHRPFGLKKSRVYGVRLWIVDGMERTVRRLRGEKRGKNGWDEQTAHVLFYAGRDRGSRNVARTASSRFMFLAQR